MAPSRCFVIGSVTLKKMEPPVVEPAITAPNGAPTYRASDWELAPEVKWASTSYAH